jgi:hypothetical protein
LCDQGSVILAQVSHHFTSSVGTTVDPGHASSRRSLDSFFKLCPLRIACSLPTAAARCQHAAYQAQHKAGFDRVLHLFSPQFIQFLIELRRRKQVHNLFARRFASAFIFAMAKSYSPRPLMKALV